MGHQILVAPGVNKVWAKCSCGCEYYLECPDTAEGRKELRIRLNQYAQERETRYTFAPGCVDEL